MTVVFQLTHEYMQEGENGEEIEEVKVLGLYSLRENAEVAIETYRTLPGFRDYPENFFIYEWTLDRNGWTEGFFTFDPNDPAYGEEFDEPGYKIPIGRTPKTRN